MASLLSRFQASMVLAAVGDAVGFKVRIFSSSNVMINAFVCLLSSGRKMGVLEGWRDHSQAIQRVGRICWVGCQLQAKVDGQ